MHFSKGLYHHNHNVYFDGGFIGRLKDGSFTKDDIQKMLLISEGSQLVILNGIKKPIIPSPEVASYIVAESLKSPLSKLTNLLPFLNKDVSIEILDKLTADDLLTVLHRLSNQYVFKLEHMRMRYTVLIQCGVKKYVKRYQHDSSSMSVDIDQIGMICYKTDLKNNNLELYQTLDKLFNVERWNNRHKLLNTLPKR